jgi:hypothetical protein
MDPVIVSVLTVLASLAVRGIAVAELFMRLRWQERQQHAHSSYLTALSRTLPPGCRLDEIRADGSELHLATAHAAEQTERPLEMTHPARPGNAEAPGPPCPLRPSPVRPR